MSKFAFWTKVTASLLALCLVGLLLASPGQAAVSGEPRAPAVTIINTDVTTDTTWTQANSPYYITDDIQIDPGVTLTIEPGVWIWMGDEVIVHVGQDGVGGATIIAKGTPSQNITFDRHDTWYRWRNIRHYEDSTSYYRYVTFHWGGEEETMLYYSGTGTHVLNRCEIKYSDRHAIYANGPVDLRIAGMLSSNHKQRNITADGGATIDITGSRLLATNSIPVYLRSSGAVCRITVEDSDLVSDSSYGAYNEYSGKVCLNAQSNWWGHATGPRDTLTGGRCDQGTNYGGGSDVSNGVDYSGWRSSSAPRVAIKTAPTVDMDVTPDPTVPLAAGEVFTFTGSGSTDVEDYTSSLSFCWDWDGDGSGCDATTMTATTTFPGGLNTVLLTVTDTDGLADSTTIDITVGPPTASFVYTQTTWAETEFDASSSSDAEDPVSSLLATWDWEGDGVFDTGAVSVTQVVTHAYPHLGRFWPALEVEDTDALTDTASRTLDVIPPAASTTVSGGGGTLDSVDGTVQVSLFTDTVDSASIGTGLVVTHTPWLTVPYAGLSGDFTYWGFDLDAETQAGGAPVDQVTGTYTITVNYVLTYFTDVAGLPAFEGRLQLYRWSGSAWTAVAFGLDTVGDQLVATTDSFGSFALVMDIRQTYLPLVLRSY